MRASFRRYFLAGLLIWLPILATVWVVHFMVHLLDQVMDFLPASLQPQAWFGMNIPGLGVVLSVLIVLGTGVLVANFLGRQLLELGESLIQRLPLIRGIYNGVKQVTQSLLSSDSKSFKKVVLVEYPRPGLWSIAFQTTDALPLFDELLKEPCISVFIPTTPNPTSGFLLIVPAKDVKELSISVETALKMVISLGVVQAPQG